MVYTRPDRARAALSAFYSGDRRGAGPLESCCWDEQSNGRKGRPTGRPFVHCNSPRANCGKPLSALNRTVEVDEILA